MIRVVSSVIDDRGASICQDNISCFKVVLL